MFLPGTADPESNGHTPCLVDITGPGIVEKQKYLYLKAIPQVDSQTLRTLKPTLRRFKSPRTGSTSLV